jgi:hypothetical protein
MSRLRQNQHNGFATSMDPDQPAHPNLRYVNWKDKKSSIQHSYLQSCFRIKQSLFRQHFNLKHFK